MNLLDIFTTINEDWKIMVFVFGLGALYYQARVWFSKLTKALDNTGRVHGEQNIALDSINQKLDNLDRRTAKIEGSIELIQLDQNIQTTKIAVLESQVQSNIIDYPVKKRVRRSNTQ